MDRVGNEIAQLIGPYLQTGQMQQSLTGDASTSLCKSLIALPVNHHACLFQFDYNGAPEMATKELPFVALGSGQPIADPFLAFIRRLLWPSSEPSISEGRLVAVWTIDHVRRTNPGGVGGGIQLATLLNGTGKAVLPIVTVLNEEDVEEHLQSVSLAEQALIQQIQGKGSATPTADIPTPP